MRLVDEKWRLFGVINIFDLFVLCAITSLIFFSFKWATIAEDPSFIKSETVHVECKGVTTVPIHISNLVKEGDTMLDANGNVICKIEKILSVAPATQLIFQSKDGEKIFLDSNQVRIAFLLDLTVYKRHDGIFFENLGCNVTDVRQITMKSKNYTILMSISEISDKP